MRALKVLTAASDDARAQVHATILTKTEWALEHHRGLNLRLCVSNEITILQNLAASCVDLRAPTDLFGAMNHPSGHGSNTGAGAGAGAGAVVVRAGDDAGAATGAEGERDEASATSAKNWRAHCSLLVKVLTHAAATARQSEQVATSVALPCLYTLAKLCTSSQGSALLQVRDAQHNIYYSTQEKN